MQACRFRRRQLLLPFASRCRSGRLLRHWGVSVDFFEEHVMHELRIVRRGRRRLIPVGELERWLEASAELTLASFR